MRFLSVLSLFSRRWRSKFCDYGRGCFRSDRGGGTYGTYFGVRSGAARRLFSDRRRMKKSASQWPPECLASPRHCTVMPFAGRRRINVAAPKHCNSTSLTEAGRCPAMTANVPAMFGRVTVRRMSLVGTHFTLLGFDPRSRMAEMAAHYRSAVRVCVIVPGPSKSEAPSLIWRDTPFAVMTYRATR
jgi:hypothetical protein